MMNGWDGADWIWMTFMMIAFWGGLAAVVVFAIKGFAGTRRSSETQTPDARKVLETRFAKGDISEEEFEDRKKALGLVGGLNRQDDGRLPGPLISHEQLEADRGSPVRADEVMQSPDFG